MLDFLKEPIIIQIENLIQSDDIPKAVWDEIRRQQYQKMAQRSNQTHFPRNQRSWGKMTQHVDQLSIHLQEYKTELISYTKEKTKESRLENFHIENHEDKIEERDKMLIWKWTQVNKNPMKKMKKKKNIEQKSNKNNDTLVAVEMNLQTIEEL